jgi:hypothetical protein
MTNVLIVTLTVLAALGSGLVARIFFAFSAFLMTALSRLPPMTTRHAPAPDARELSGPSPRAFPLYQSKGNVGLHRDTPSLLSAGTALARQAC